MKRLIVLVTVLISIGLLSFIPAYAATPVGISGTADALNTGGTLDFTNFNSNVEVDSDTGDFSGFVWSTDVGWVDFSGVTVSLTTGVVGGTAAVLNTGGFIYFSSYNSNVVVDLDSGAFSGYGWSDDLGWIDFGDVLADQGLARTGSPAIVPVIAGGLVLLAASQVKKVLR